MVEYGQAAAAKASEQAQAAYECALPLECISDSVHRMRCWRAHEVLVERQGSSTFCVQALVVVTALWRLDAAYAWCMLAGTVGSCYHTRRRMPL